MSHSNNMGRWRRWGGGEVEERERRWLREGRGGGGEGEVVEEVGEDRGLRGRRLKTGGGGRGKGEVDERGRSRRGGREGEEEMSLAVWGHYVLHSQCSGSLRTYCPNQ